MDEKTLEYIAQLARLELPTDEKAGMLEHMQRILDYMDELNTVCTDDVPPLIQADGITNVLRADEVTPSFPREALMDNAPKQLDGAYQVPKVIE